MGAIATFNFTTWSSRFPEFASLNPSLAAQYFAEAGLFLNNIGGSPVPDVSTQTVLMNLLTAHIAKLNAPISGSQVGLVGRISGASEGSVNVQTQLNVPAGSAQYFAQTTYGLEYWQATARFRSFRYAPSFRRRAWGGIWRRV